MHAKASRGEISKTVISEFDEATKKQKGGFSKLPEHKTPIDEHYRHEEHGAAGSHENSHKKLGGARAKIMTGSPEEQ